MTRSESTQSTKPALLQGIDIPASVFENRLDFIRAVREGISGSVVRQAIAVIGHRDLFVDILGVKSANLCRVYRRKRLSKRDSESVLDLLRVVGESARIFEARNLAEEWLSTALPVLGGSRPIDLCNTFEGRSLVCASLRKIEHGDFS